MMACRKPFPYPGRGAAGRALCGLLRCRAGAVTNAGLWDGPGSAEQREERAAPRPGDG
jgi:hypothetical protein